MSSITCSNPWCSTATRTHKSVFAKKRCDESSSRTLAIDDTALRPRRGKGTREVTAVDGSVKNHTRWKFADIKDAHLADALIHNATMPEAEGTVFSGARLQNVNFAGGCHTVMFDGAIGSDVTFQFTLRECNLEGAKIARLTIGERMVIENSSLASARLNESTWHGGTRVSDTSFQWASMRRSNFSESIVFHNCDFSGCDLASSTFAGHVDGDPTFVDCEIDMANFSAVNLRDVHFAGVDLTQRIYFVDEDTLPPLQPGTLDETEDGQEFMTRSMTEEQYARYLDEIGASELEVRQAIGVLSPAFIPVYADGSMGERGDLVRRALLGEDITTLAQMQAELWAGSAEHNPLLALDPGRLYS